MWWETQATPKPMRTVQSQSYVEMASVRQAPSERPPPNHQNKIVLRSKTGKAAFWVEFCPFKAIEVLTSRASECDCIWRHSL